MMRSVVCVLCIITVFPFIYQTGAIGIGTGRLPMTTFMYIYGTLINYPRTWFTPPRNKNDSLGYRVFTKRNPQHPCFLEQTLESLQSCQIDPSDPLLMVVCGFIEELKPGNLFEVIKEKVLDNGPFTVIILDWTKYNGPPASLALDNMDVIGPLAAQMLNFITEHARVPPQNMILVGHSMGAHLVGLIGRHVPNLRRIDSLDPNGIYVDGEASRSGISPDDAAFVRVYHTSNSDTSWGTSIPRGHIDIYFNDGKKQPGCADGYQIQRQSGDFVTIDSFQRRFSCPHQLIVTYYIYGINTTDCEFLATHCQSFEHFDGGKCPPNESVTADVGFYGGRVEGLPINSKFFVKTHDKPPYYMKKRQRPKL